MLLGEVAKEGRLANVKRIVATQDEILDALFDRTYEALSPAAKRAYLTLCDWRSAVPEIAFQAVLLRPTNEKIDIVSAIDELIRSSFVERGISQKDETAFLGVPLVASVFGKRRLAVSSLRIAVQSDTELLRMLGAAKSSDIRHGIQPQITKMFRKVAEIISHDVGKLEEYLPVLRFIGKHHPPAWLLLATLYEEWESPEARDKARGAIRRYLECDLTSKERYDGWIRLVELCRRSRNWIEEMQAHWELCQLSSVPYAVLSNSANRINYIYREYWVTIDSDEKQILLRGIVEALERRIDEADAGDCSRIAWLLLHLKEPGRARAVTNAGLAKDPHNIHCLRLDEKLLDVERG